MRWRRSVDSAPPQSTSERAPAQVLLDRLGTIYLPDGSPSGRQGDAPVEVPDPVSSVGVTLLEAELLDRGFLASATLVQRLLGLDAGHLATRGALLLADLDAALGSDRPHVPLFRGFPRSVPSDTVALWVDRVLTLIAQSPEQPCVLCGNSRTMVAVSPCAHLVCRVCFDAHDYSACPICRRRLDPGGLFIEQGRPRAPGRSSALPARLRVLTVGVDYRADVRREVDALLARTAALTPQDGDDLFVLLDSLDRGDLGWLPDEIPARETKARVLAWLLADPAHRSVALPAVTARIGTATDALRLLVVLSGGDAGFIDPPKFAAIPRPVRRAVLAALNRLDPGTVIEDLSRHQRLWVHAAEKLHPFEYAQAYPMAAVAFAALRERFLSGVGHLNLLLATTATECGLEIRDGRIRHRSHAALVEQGFEAGDIDAAVRLLKARPGEFVRRLDHLLRLAEGAGSSQPDQVLAVLSLVLGRVSPAVLVSALGELRLRGHGQARRIFFPSGGNAKIHVIPDERPPLSEDVVEQVVGLLTAELLRRAERLGPVATVALDESLDRLIAPFTQRTASRALVTVPRGSLIQLPVGRHLRLFLHWMEAEQRVDLDLSVAMFDATWKHVATCDYTNMRVAGDGAVHSGDLTSAPAPMGASEFIDVDLKRLAAAGVHHVVAAVFSFNNVAFEDMPEAFAGVLLRADDPRHGPIFDPRSVEQRFDLAGRARSSVPFILDLQAGTMRWLDVALGVTGTFHDVHRHAGALEQIGQSLGEYYAAGARVSLGEIARWHAAARAATVLVRNEHGIARFDRHSGEDADIFLRRLTAGAGALPAVAGQLPDLAFLERGDLDCSDGATVYALHPADLDAQRVRLISPADVGGSLLPEGD
ncbi:MAG TPA: MXAN_6230/SCO0854 family RING domain-containing protein [Kineosporiaceae bacterium]|nr:MXAN_6230/SCO0854 family RING domain-containing protein [Kineosporiaceae bacterium]